MSVDATNDDVEQCHHVQSLRRLLSLPEQPFPSPLQGRPLGARARVLKEASPLPSDAEAVQLLRSLCTSRHPQDEQRQRRLHLCIAPPSSSSSSSSPPPNANDDGALPPATVTVLLNRKRHYAAETPQSPSSKGRPLGAPPLPQKRPRFAPYSAALRRSAVVMYDDLRRKAPTLSNLQVATLVAQAIEARQRVLLARTFGLRATGTAETAGETPSPKSICLWYEHWQQQQQQQRQ
jgi:hypothetical protein